MKKILVFASGSKDGGGSGFRVLADGCKNGAIDGKICAVVSNHENGGVRHKADDLGIMFEHFSGPYDTAGYAAIIERYNPDLICLSGWLKKVTGLDPRKTINIHPGLLPLTAGMYGHFVHEKMIEACNNGEATHTAVTMHFVTEQYDEGPIIFQHALKIQFHDTPDSLAESVNKLEHEWQATITNLVLQGEISWDGSDPQSLRVPSKYRFLDLKTTLV